MALGTNIAMENQHLGIGKSTIHGPFSIAMLNYQMVICCSLLLKMAIEIVTLPIENSGFSSSQAARNFQTVATALGAPLGAVRPQPPGPAVPAVPVGRPVFAPAQPSSIYGHQPEMHLGLGSKLDKSGVGKCPMTWEYKGHHLK